MRQLYKRPVWAAAAAAIFVIAAAGACSSPSSDIFPSDNASQQPAESGDAMPVANQGTPEPPLGDIPSSQDVEDMSPLEIVSAYESVLNGVYEQSLPSVVNITVFSESTSQFFLPPPQGGDGDGGIQPQSGGSGFVWDEQGHIVTNHHVVAEASRITVEFSDGAVFDAEVIGGDSDSDLAVLELQDTGDREFDPLPMADSDEVNVGQISIAIGNPFAESFTMTQGIVSAVGRTIRSGPEGFSTPDVIQTDAPINPGNSGGPLLDAHGRVIGINTQIKSRSGSNSGVGFAVPSNTAQRVVPELVQDGDYEYSWLGISGRPVNREIADAMDLPEGTRGAMVINVVDDGPADQAGIEGAGRETTINGLPTEIGGDVIVAINDTAVEDMEDLISYLANRTQPGDTVTFTIHKDGGEQTTVDVTLGERPD